jgi:pimeloyl-ACP methyl ester carboxylesterase
MSFHKICNASSTWLARQRSSLGESQSLPINLPFPVLTLNFLGYGGTFKLTDVSYNSKSMTGDLSEINDAEGVDKAIVVGHD